MYDLYAQFPKQQITKDRQYGGLSKWSGYIVALPIPEEKPDRNWVEQRILAARMPNQIQQHIDATLGWVIRDPAIQTNIRQHLNAFNDEATEAAMNANVDGALAVSMPGYAKTVVQGYEVDQWYNDNGFPTGPGAPSGAMPGGAMPGGNPPVGGTR